jgi:hypothetical protein
MQGNGGISPPPVILFRRAEQDSGGSSAALAAERPGRQNLFRIWRTNAEGGLSAMAEQDCGESSVA